MGGGFPEEIETCLAIEGREEREGKQGRTRREEESERGGDKGGGRGV